MNQTRNNESSRTSAIQEVVAVKPTKLWNKNFIMLIIGQIVSLFGNAILRFALPLYILLEYGSPELMGRVLALSVIPMIVVSPLGGVLADRVNKKRLIVFLDFITAICSFLFLWAVGALSIVPITIIMLMLLITINAMMNAATDSSYPLIVPEDQLVRANSMSMTINTLAMMLGPMLGGVLIVGFGLNSLLLVGGICFAMAAVMELFIHIPRVSHDSSGGLMKIVIGDISDGLRFAMHTQPIIAKILLVIILFALVISSFGLVGVPVLITQNLGMDARMVGIASGIMGAGGIAGGVISGILGQKIRIQKNHWKLLGTGLCLIPIGLVFLIPVGNVVAFAVITAMLFMAMGITTMFTIQILTFVQRVSPPEYIGKMVALIMSATVLSQPIGQWTYGFLFEHLGETPWIIIFPAAFVGMLIALWSRKHFKCIV